MSGIPSILFVDTLSGILRFLPLTLTLTFLFLGIMLNNMPWLIAGSGVLSVIVLVLTFQWLFDKASFVPRTVMGLNLAGYFSDAMSLTCSLVPGNSYAQFPSLWFALMGYFFTYILLNAGSIYNRTPATAPGYSPAGQGSHVLVGKPVSVSANSIGVVQRRSVGLLSIIAVCILFAIIMIPRFMNHCESILGILAGLAIGSLSGWGIWTGVNSNQNPLADIHGVVLGLSPGYLRHTPIACTPASGPTA
jgi:hypothetical protein